MAVGNTSVILGLWPLHLFWTYYYTLSAKALVPILKFVVCVCLVVALILWPVVGVPASIIGGLLYGFLSPFFATFDALKEERRMHSIIALLLLSLPTAFIAVVVGVIIDVLVISFVAIFKGPYMLFKGWQRLLQDLIGREGPFLETICVPFAGLAILLWPLPVVGAVLGSIVASFFLGGYVVVFASMVKKLCILVCMSHLYGWGFVTPFLPWLYI